MLGLVQKSVHDKCALFLVYMWKPYQCHKTNSLKSGFHVVGQILKLRTVKSWWKSPTNSQPHILTTVDERHEGWQTSEGAGNWCNSEQPNDHINEVFVKEIQQKQSCTNQNYEDHNHDGGDWEFPYFFIFVGNSPILLQLFSFHFTRKRTGDYFESHHLILLIKKGIYFWAKV